MKIIGLTKVRNEEEIIKDTLDAWADICSGGIYVYDDVSDDRTVEICKNHKGVKGVIEGDYWDPDREKAEWFNRQAVLEKAQENAKSDDWFVYFDADEFPFQVKYSHFFNDNIDAVACRLYDVYITPKDKKYHYKDRKWVGPEFRTIVMFFRNSAFISYDKPDQRIVNLGPHAKIAVDGIIKHYGKGFSEKHWDNTCDYYIDHWPKYSEKWKKRKGKAVKYDHKSDFGNTLIEFDRVLRGEVEGIPLELQVYGKN